MKITRVTENNIEYFRGEIGEFYRKGDTRRICLGLIDDDGNAVGAAVLDLEPGDAMIRYFAISDNHRGKGYGRFFIDEIVKTLNSAIYSRLMFCEFDMGVSDAIGFLSACGFTTEKSDTRRTLYNMEDVRRAVPFGSGRLPEGRKLVRGAAADEELRSKIFGLAENLNSDNYIDARFLTSMKNRYGGIIVEDGEIKAMLGVERFGDGARLESIYIDTGTMDELLYLFDYAVNAINMESEPLKTLYIDTNGEKLLKFEDTVMKRKMVGCRERLEGMVAWKQLG